ncbi:MAG: KUP/HAK/KT family potassium transporter [Phycisphaerales bacterium]|jgi:KUP system potassium uptake protein|nr:KUP/HAK/KT family potassium transporter [Phycisphaerales bacterium]
MGGPAPQKPTHRQRQGVPLLALAAIGVVFGDIGTSPLYALKATLALGGADATSPAHVMGALSLMVWALFFVIGFKYISLLMRADNGGEGGLLALLSLTRSREDEAGGPAGRWLLWTALAGAALLYGDGIITPAISVLSAMGGLEPAHEARHAHWVVVASAFIVIGVFLTQRFGSGRIGWLVGPLMLAWFVLIAVLGVRGILAEPGVLTAFSPTWGIALIGEAPGVAFLMLGGVVLCLTGGEALYADMGHFGRRAITLAWWVVVCPSLLASYFGQGAAVLADPTSAANPFFALVPDGMRISMVVIATLAAIIASQAIISGVFSTTRQLAQHGVIPPLKVVHTSDVEGQIFIPAANMLMAIACVLVVLLFGSAAALAGAYGLAVTGVMAISTVLFSVVARRRWRWSWWLIGPLAGTVLSVDLLFLSANAFKVLDGGWMPLLVAAVILILVGTWRQGMRLVNRGRLEDGLPLDRFVESLKDGAIERWPGTGVFFARSTQITPVTIRKLHRHVPGFPETILIVYLQPLGVPRVPYQQRLRLDALGQGVWMAFVRFGYLQQPDVPAMVRDAVERGLPTDPNTLTYWIRRDQVAIAGDHRGMARWRTAVFAYLLRNATVLPDMLDLPPRRTVEVGMRAPL